MWVEGIDTGMALSLKKFKESTALAVDILALSPVLKEPSSFE